MRRLQVKNSFVASDYLRDRTGSTARLTITQNKVVPLELPSCPCPWIPGEGELDVSTYFRRRKINPNFSGKLGGLLLTSSLLVKDSSSFRWLFRD